MNPGPLLRSAANAIPSWGVALGAGRRLTVGSWWDAVRMIQFCDNDAAYLEWISANEQGFVLNTYRSPRPDYIRLHRATCHLIRGVPSNGARWTSTYVKVCGGRSDLERWAASVVGGAIWECSRCL